MTKINMGNGMDFDPETNELFVKGMNEPIKTIPLNETELEGLNEWHSVLEGKKQKD